MMWEALRGQLSDTHRFLLPTHLTQWDAPEAAVKAIDRQVDTLIGGFEQVARFRLLIALLCKVPGNDAKYDTRQGRGMTDGDGMCLQAG